MKDAGDRKMSSEFESSVAAHGWTLLCGGTWLDSPLWRHVVGFSSVAAHGWTLLCGGLSSVVDSPLWLDSPLWHDHHGQASNVEEIRHGKEIFELARLTTATQLMSTIVIQMSVQHSSLCNSGIQAIL